MMKKVDVFVLSEKTEAVLYALESSNYKVKFYDSKGMGKGEKPELSFKGRMMKMKY